jgi:hypothetical protein
MPRVDMDRRFLRKSGRTGSSYCPGAGSGEHDRFSGVRPGETLLATVTEQGSVRHLSVVVSGQSLKETKIRA